MLIGWLPRTTTNKPPPNTTTTSSSLSQEIKKQEVQDAGEVRKEARATILTISTRYMSNVTCYAGNVTKIDDQRR